MKASKLVRKHARTAKIRRLQDKIAVAEEAYQNKDTHTLFSVVRQVAPRRRFQKLQLKGPDGLLLDPQQALESLTDHFGSVFNDGSSAPLAVPQMREPFLITTADIQHRLNKLKTGKAVPSFAAPGSVWKCCRATLAPLLEAAWTMHTGVPKPDIPAVWKDCELVLLPKKEEVGARLPKSLRPLGLQEVSGKLFAGCLRDELFRQVQPALISYPQFALMKGRSVHDAISRVVARCHSARQKLAGSNRTVFDRRQGLPAAPGFAAATLSLDLSLAFDLVPRWAMFASLIHFGVTDSLCCLIMQWHDHNHYKIKHHGLEATVLLIRGVRQGCCLAPLLFAVFSCYLFEELAKETSADWVRDFCIAFADDTSYTWEAVSPAGLDYVARSVRSVFRVFNKRGMRVNADKSAFLIQVRGKLCHEWLARLLVVRAGVQMINLGTGLEPLWLPRQSMIPYLGVVVSFGNFEKQTVSKRLSAFRTARTRLIKILHDRHKLPAVLRLRLYGCCVRSVLLYGLHVVGLPSEQLRRVRGADAKSIRAMLLSPVHLTRENTVDLLKRYGFPELSACLLTAADNRAVGLSHLGWSDPLSAWGIAKHQELLRSADVLKNVTQRSSLVPAPSSAQNGGFPCDVCGIYFSSPPDMKKHRTRKHPDAASLVGDLSPVDYQSFVTDGTPVCNRCGTKYKSVQNFRKHVANTCPKRHLSREEALAERSAAERPPVDQPERGSSQWEKVVQPLASSTPLFFQPSFRALCQQPNATALLLAKQQDVCAYLREYCMFCGQWTSSAFRGAKIHIRKMHPEHIPALNDAVAFCLKLHVPSPCFACLVEFKPKTQHVKICRVMCQLELALRLIRSQVSDADFTRRGDRRQPAVEHVRGSFPQKVSGPEGSEGGGDSGGTRRESGSGPGAPTRARAPAGRATGARKPRTKETGTRATNGAATVRAQRLRVPKILTRKT
jgi:hypothetical protein